MLQVLLYDEDHAVRSEMLDCLNAYARDVGGRFSVLYNTDSEKEASVCIEAEDGILLLIGGVEGRAGAEEASVRLERLVIGKNRDSYMLYWLKDISALPALASSCLHPVGFILPPTDQKHFNNILRRVMEDFAAFDNSPADNFLSLQIGGTVHRLQISAIDYIEALDKKLNIWTDRQCVTVYEKLGKMEEVLGERFFRCHRSYLVHYSHIESVDYAAMELTLKSGARLPLSRSGKDRLKERFTEEGAPNGG